MSKSVYQSSVSAEWMRKSIQGHIAASPKICESREVEVIQIRWGDQSHIREMRHPIARV